MGGQTIQVQVPAAPMPTAQPGAMPMAQQVPAGQPHLPYAQPVPQAPMQACYAQPHQQNVPMTKEQLKALKKANKKEKKEKTSGEISRHGKRRLQNLWRDFRLVDTGN